MSENQREPNKLLDTTDCLEAVGVFRNWKNFLFVIIFCSLLLLQISFWMLDIGYVKTDAALSEPPEAMVSELIETEQTKKITKAAKQVSTEPNQPVVVEVAAKKIIPSFNFKISHLSWLIRVLNFVLIFAAVLYCLTLLFCLKISLASQFGGINHICRAFFLSLFFVVLLLPWQQLFSGITSGILYTPAELLGWHGGLKDTGTLNIVFYYLRFVGYWGLAVLVLIFAQIRSSRWAKAILHRLEII
ncbi:MAG: hypothetical protein KAQ89_05580 [Planctomycetes bacterium]|nr:hypothetical protein [Planctomycetota bacterium]